MVTVSAQTTLSFSCLHLFTGTDPRRAARRALSISQHMLCRPDRPLPASLASLTDSEDSFCESRGSAALPSPVQTARSCCSRSSACHSGMKSCSICYIPSAPRPGATFPCLSRTLSRTRPVLQQTH